LINLPNQENQKLSSLEKEGKISLPEGREIGEFEKLSWYNPPSKFLKEFCHPRFLSGLLLKGGAFLYLLKLKFSWGIHLPIHT